MKTKSKNDFFLQSAVLDLGRSLAKRFVSASLQATDGCPSADDVDTKTKAVLSLVRASSARSYFGIEAARTDEDEIRVRVVALLGWRVLGESQLFMILSDLTNAVMCGGQEDFCRQLLRTRDCISGMIGDKLIVPSQDTSGNRGAGLGLPLSCYAWLCGCSQTKKGNQQNDPIPVQTSVPTARELYDSVRTSVVGIDPQVKVLASRFALHVARADAIKAGVDDNTVGQMVVCLVGSSGASKSFLASRMAKASGLPHVQFDATTLTASGYVGSDLDDVYKLLVGSAGGDATVASRGICFLDEFDKKSSRYGRDVNGEAVQMELLSKLQATSTPFLVGGKRAGDFGRQFLFDGRPTGYILAGVFKGLDDEIEKMAGRKNIGFASHSGNRQHIRIADCLKELGFLDELVNRIGLVMRLPDPTMENVMRATAGGILDGFNAVLAPQDISMLLTTKAICSIGEYAMSSKAFYRGAKAVLATVAEEIVFDKPSGKIIFVNDSDVRRAVERLSSGFLQPNDESRVSLAAPVPEPDGEADVLSAGG